MAEKKQAAAETNYRQKYTGLLQEWNELAGKWNNLVKEHETISDAVVGKDTEIDNLKGEIVQIKNDTITHDNITIGKLLEAIKHLSIGKLIGIIGFFVALIVGSFKLGQMYQETAMNYTQYDIKKEINSLKDTINARDRQIDYVRRNSDSAHVILSYMPYKQMTLDSTSFRKVQTTTENAGAALDLNKETR